MNIDKPVFIGGSGSSGSTLLRTILNRHPKFYCGRELSVFNKRRFIVNFDKVKRNLDDHLEKGLSTSGYVKYYKFFANKEAYDLNKKLIKEWAGNSKSFREFSTKLFRHALEKSGKTNFAEKTPSNTYNFDALLQCFPKAKFILIHRDGRDVVCSLKKRGFNWFQASSRWLYNTVCGLQISNTGNLYLIAYEKLVNNPEKEIKELCRFLEIRFYPQMILKENEEHVTKRSITSWNFYPGQKISNAAVGKFRNELNKTGKAVFLNTRLTEHSAKRLEAPILSVPELMDELGYQVSEDRAPVSLRVKKEMMAERIYRFLKELKNREKPRRPFTELAV